MKGILIPCITLMVVAILFLAFQSPKMNNMKANPNDDPYQQQWKEIDSLETQGLPRSALAKVKELYESITIAEMPAQAVKCLLYINKYEQQLNEDGLALAISNLEKEMEKASFPLKPVLQSILGEAYSNYLDRNYWQISNRTEAPEEKLEDIKTWPVERLVARSASLFLASVEDNRIKEVPIADWSAILTDGNTDKLRPGLYDFLIHRAIDHFSNERYYLPEPAYAFYLDEEDYLKPASVFTEIEIQAEDEASFKFKTLQLYQEALVSHLKDEDPAALIDLDLKRIRFVNNNSTLANKRDLYREALLNLLMKDALHPASAEILYYLANDYYQTSENYHPLKDTINRWDAQKAWEICQDAIDKYPESYGASYCKRLLREIERKELSLRLEEVNLPAKPILVRLDFRNVSKIYLRLVKMHKLDRIEVPGLNTEQIEKLLLEGDAVRSWEETLPLSGDFQKHAVELKIDPLEKGLYALVYSDQPDFSLDKGETGYVFTQVSQLAYFNRRNQNQTEFVVVDRESGEPIQGVLVELYTTQYNRNKRRSEYIYLTNTYTDRNGMARPKVKDGQYFQVKLNYKDDILFFPDGFSSYSNSVDRSRFVEQTVFFLDRAIYRPGQTVHFKGLVVGKEGDNLPNIQSGRKVEVSLLDVNNQEVETQSFQTNEYGTFHGSFRAPRGGLLGSMTLLSDVGNSRKRFRVEEYKRPKFEVTFDPLAEDYQLGDTVKVKALAKAYAGSVIDGAKVQYRVVRETRFPWRPWWSRSIFPGESESMEITSGEMETGTDGTFEISFPALPDPEADSDRFKPLFFFTVYADVTDITGETHSAEKSVQLAKIGLTARVEMPPQLDRSEPFKTTIITENLEGQTQAASGEIKVHRLDAPQRIFLKRYWEIPDLKLIPEKEFTAAFPHFAYQGEDQVDQWPKKEQVFQAAFNTGNSQSLELPVQSWPVGHYWLDLTTTDSKGNAVQYTGYFWVYDQQAKTLPANIMSWAPAPEQTFQPGATVPWFIASSEDKLKVLFGLERKSTLLEEKWLDVNKWEENNFELGEADRGNVFCHYTFVKNNRTFSGRQLIKVPWTNKQLSIEFSTFRDKLQPGQEEEWQIKVSGPEKEVVAVEMVASMYDASLDVFVPNSWAYFPYPVQSYASLGWQVPHFSRTDSRRFQYLYNPPRSMPMRNYRQLEWFGFFYGRRGRGIGGRQELSMRAAPRSHDLPVAADMMMKNEAAPPPPPEPEVMEYSLKKVEATTETAPKIAPPIRKNLEETVFFFPELKTDAEGNILLRFKMKEALTRWKLLTWAHTKELQIGSASQEVVTQKELMVQPNPPRFLREGDQIEFTAKVSNMTEETMQGTARIEFFNPHSGDIISPQLLQSESSLSFSAPAGQSAPLAWKLAVPESGLTMVGHRVIASAGAYSDGEESALPVLTNRVLVTESLPITINGETTQEFTFDAMKKAAASTTLDHQSFTLEFTSNPAWYAVKALPYMMEYPYECTEQIFSRYYANSLASSVANAHPKVKDVFEDWKNTKVLESNLMQNEELKAVLLEETPWVMQAQTEAQQRQQIGLLFDLNRMAEEQSKALYQMVERQSGDGGFSWFPGGRDSWYITQYIVAGLGHLDALGVQEIQQNSITRQMVEKSVDFIDGELLNSYRELEKRVAAGKTKWEDDHLHNLAIHYLYTRSFFQEKEMNDDLQKAYKYYIDQANSHWLSKGLYQQGLIALGLHRFGLNVTPQRILKSLDERALRNEELGMYWKGDRGYFWYQMPIETHALLMEVFAELSEDKTAMDGLKRWLLKNKQTNHWGTTKATANAVYALLQYGSDWLMAEQDVDIKFSDLRKRAYKNKLTAAQQTAEAGTGYFQVKWPANEISADLAKVKIKNDNDQLAWGALYWQYLENADKVEKFKDTPLSIDKKVFKSVLTDRGPELKAVGESTKLQPGDKLTVRIELRVDRQMEYIHMKDMRASGLEPMNVLSQYKWQEGLGYYESTRDASTNFFIEHLPRGTYVFEYPLRVIHRGDFSNGITTIQCMYAPEFTSHSEGIRIEVE